MAEFFIPFLGYFFFGCTYFISVFMFCSKELRAKNFYFKLSLFAIGYTAFCAVSAVLDMYTDTDWLDFFIYTLIAVTVAIFALLTSRENKARLFYKVLAAMLIRNAASKAINCIFHFCPLNSNIGQTLITSAFIIVSYIPVYFLFARKISNDTEFKPVIFELIFIMVLMMLLLPAAYLEPVISEINSIAYIYLIIIEIIFCYGILGFQYIIHIHALQKVNIIRENEFNKQRISQYESFSAVIEVMNHKIHDLKHQIRHIGNEYSVNDEVIRGLEKTVAEYGAFVKTGNEVLDTVFTEKNFACIANKINAKFMVDGAAFGFLSVEDINALFGNLLDNALEYLAKIDEDKRTLSVISSKTELFLKLSVENYCERTVDFDKKGFPTTDKPDKSMHGFGVKSVARIAEKYSGNVSYRVEDGLFKAQVIFPLNLPA